MNNTNRAAKILEGNEAVEALERLGLNQAPLVRAALTYALELRGCSPLEPKSAPGFKAWSTSFGVLAEETIPLGFRKFEEKGLPRMVHPERRIGLAIVGGDEATGIEGLDPRSKNSRGKVSQRFVRSNERQLNLFGGDMAEFQPIPDSSEIATWWLLVYSRNGQIRAELSFPTAVGEDRRLESWAERIIIEIPQDGFEATRLAPSDGATPLDIEVRPRD